MSSIPGASSTNSSNDKSAAGVNQAFAALGPDDFLKMMLAQLQNQSPLDPMNSSDMLQELSVMSQVSSSQGLSSTLNAVQLGQNLSNAGTLIGATVTGLNDSAKHITGTVESVTISGGTPKLNIGSDTMSLNNIEAIYPYGTDPSTIPASAAADGSDG